MPSTPLLVITNCPDVACAEAIADQLLAQRLAACINLLPPVRAIYRWQGKIQRASEVPLLIKTTAGRYPAVAAAIGARHPYEVPEIIALPITHGLPAYLDWLAAETAPAGSADR